MKIIRPVEVTNSVLTASNITENDYAEWDVATTYAAGDKVIVIGTTHRIFESKINSNVGNDPTTDDGTNWLNLGATNKWRPFDGVIADQATNADTITYTLDPQSLTNSIAFFNLQANELVVTMTDPTDGVVYNNTINLVNNDAVTSWWGYFFEPIERTKEVILFDLPNYASAELGITIDNTGSDAKVGQIVFGNQLDLGLTTYGTTIGIQDYSRKEVDAFGNATIQERRYAQTVDYDVKVATTNVRSVQNTLATYRATPIVYTGTTDGQYGDLVYGYYRNFSINISTPSFSDATIEVEGLV